MMLKPLVLSLPATPVVVLPGMTACGGAAYWYAWQRARVLAAQQAWARFDPTWN